MLVKEIGRSSVISWSPIKKYQHYLVGGTLSGTMSSDFDPSGKLEIFDLSPSNDLNARLIGGCQVKERFNVISWKDTNPNQFECGLVVAGFPSGTLGIYDPSKIIRNDKNVVVAEVKSHSSSLNALEFNPFQSTLLASGGSNSEVFIWNLASPSKPSVYTPGESPPSQSHSDIVATAWNTKHKHILSTCAQNGNIAIWDLREKKSIFTFSDPSKRARYKAIVWNPEHPMQIAAASYDDECPVIHLWDLSMTMEPSKAFYGHSRGITCMEWSRADTSILMSSGKDNRIICWDINSGEAVCDIGQASNYNFDVKWSPLMPTTLASASLDGKIRVYSVQDFSSQQTSFTSSFGHIQNQQQQQTSLPKRPPGWLIPKAGARFSFGGKLITFNKNSKNVNISCVITEPDLIEEAKKLESTMFNGTYVEFCDEKIKSLSNQTGKEAEEERLMWAFIKSTLNGEGNTRKELLSHLNYDMTTVQQTIDQYLSGLPKSSELDEVEKEEDEQTMTNKTPQPESLIDDFSQLEKRALEMQQKNQSKVIDFSNTNKNDSVLITCLITGNLESAVECCIRNGNMADALAIAASAGNKLWEKTLKVYFKQNRSKPYVSILNAVSTKDFNQLIECVDLKYWKEVLAILCTYADKDIFQHLCSSLGDRLKNEASDLRRATLCYICSGSIDKVAPYWTSRIKEASNSGYHLHQLIEKLFVLSKSVNASDDIMAEYIGNYYQSYSEMLSSQGCLSLALYFLSNVRGNTSESCQILLDRLYHSLGEKAKSIVSAPPPSPFHKSQTLSGPMQNVDQNNFQRYPSNAPNGKTYSRPTTHRPLITPNQNTLPLYQSNQTSSYVQTEQQPKVTQVPPNPTQPKTNFLQTPQGHFKPSSAPNTNQKTLFQPTNIQYPNSNNPSPVTFTSGKIPQNPSSPVLGGNRMFQPSQVPSQPQTTFQPTTQPTTTFKPPQPTTTFQPPQPQTTFQPTTQSTTTFKPPQPTTTFQPPQPQTTFQPTTQPTTTFKPPQPTTTFQPPQPQTTFQPTQPTQPTTTFKPPQPQTTFQPPQPQTTFQPTQPTQPTTTFQPPQPTTTFQPTQPTQPTTTFKPPQPTTTFQPPQPTTTFQPTQPTTFKPSQPQSSFQSPQPNPVVLNPNQSQPTSYMMQTPNVQTQEQMGQFQPMNTFQPPTQTSSPQTSTTPPPPPKGKGRRKANGSGRKPRTLGT